MLSATVETRDEIKYFLYSICPPGLYLMARFRMEIIPIIKILTVQVQTSWMKKISHKSQTQQ